MPPATEMLFEVSIDTDEIPSTADGELFLTYGFLGKRQA
jgi:hypothetical protein